MMIIMAATTIRKLPFRSRDVRCCPARSGWVEITTVTGTKLVIFVCGTKNCDLAKEADLYHDRQIE
jgi:hypothetical protein